MTIILSLFHYSSASGSLLSHPVHSRSSTPQTQRFEMAVPESNGKTVLITGINGYIASVLGMHLLSNGYSIRGTSRKAASAEPLIKGPYAPYADRVTMYEVPDMTIHGAFDEAVKGQRKIYPDFALSHVLTCLESRSAWHLPHRIPNQRPMRHS
jgi:hypothetical protein